MNKKISLGILFVVCILGISMISAGWFTGNVITGNVKNSSSYHSADYNHDWKISGTEYNRVASYWRAGNYYCNSKGYDGYASGKGSHNCSYHSADYNKDWKISNSEYLRVKVYFKDSQGYYINKEGFDGFAACNSCSGKCQNGVCVPKHTCTDSDGGLNYGVKGNISESAIGGSILFKDNCSLIQGKNLLNEMYCTNEGQLGSLKVYDCSLEGKVCQDGACVSSSSGEVTYPAIGRYFHPADTNKDWKISMGEYASYKSLIGVENCNQDHL